MTRYLLPIFLVVVSFGLFFGFTSPVLTDIENARAKSAELESALANDRDLQTIRSEKLGVYNSFSDEELGRIDKALPNSVDNVRLIIDIDNLASKYNMAVKNAKIKTDERGQETIGADTRGYGTVTLAFSVTGSYNDMRFFLRDLETSLRLVDVTSLSFSASEQDLNDYAIEVQTYWLK
ncbi:MAG: hypothetical protein COV10_02140 [Candidatus Vogelbacteria bacterium CG10_big_fil_rev_8_21_14_0_10_51_16]|uniref:Type 4a pilus biogenesis protein PilO n=1 Tax=Candidatus Vogelbacteria bacterium CG10_big_fil_rev_8_21_14_0_10_51_16 TaxID=1975045 RepID=A0A2H0REN6_9BACT|nr:MAG: hypothetical protein COV10_02140 [Candidatus Vogelbacteria bacterium CG10_big_fil_rev_8_21_14_0_10_51_16]